MKKCPHCGKEIPDRAVKCKYCYNFLDKEDKNDQKEEEYTKNKKILTAEESKELKELEKFYNKNSNSLLNEIEGYSGCLTWLLAILLWILSLCIDGFESDYGNTGYIILAVVALVFILSCTVTLYKQTNNYINYTGVNVPGGAVSYWIPIIHYISSPKLVEQIGLKFYNDEKFSKHLSNDYQVNRWINLVYSLFIGLVGCVLYGYFNNYFNNSYWSIMEFIMPTIITYMVYITYYHNRLYAIEQCIQGRIDELRGEDRAEKSEDILKDN